MADLKNTITAGNSRLWAQDLLQFYPNGIELKYGPNASDIYNTDTYPLVHSFTDTHVDAANHMLTSAEGGQFLYDMAKNNADTKADWVASSNGNADSSVVQYAKQLDSPINIQIKGAVTGIVYDWSGDNTDIVIDTLATSSPTLTLDGDVTGTATFTNLGNVTLNATVANNSHDHVSANITDATSNNSANTIVKRDENRNFSANIVTAALDGNATTSSKWETARVLTTTLTGVITGTASISVDGTDNKTVNILTTVTSDPTLTLSGDASGSATFTNLGSTTLDVTITNLDASKIDSGTISDARLPDSITSDITGNAATATLANTLNVNTSTSGTFYGVMWNSGNTVYTASGKLEVQPSTVALRSDNNITAYYSDERLKDIHEHLDPIEALKHVCEWRKVRYTANQIAHDLGNYDMSKPEIGLLAGEIEKNYPEIVPYAPFDRDKNDESKSGEDYKTLHYERVVTVQAAAIEGLNILTDRLQSEIAELKKPWYKKLFKHITNRK